MIVVYCIVGWIIISIIIGVASSSIRDNKNREMLLRAQESGKRRMEMEIMARQAAIAEEDARLRQNIAEGVRMSSTRNGFCQRCGVKNQDSARFCSHCGQSLD